MLSATLNCGATGKVEIFLEQREAAFLSPSKFSTVYPEKIKFLQILRGDKNASYLPTMYQLKKSFSKCSWEILDEKRSNGITFGLDINFYDSCQKKFVAKYCVQQSASKRKVVR